MMVLSSCYFTLWLHPRVMLMKRLIIHRGFLSAERSTILCIILMSGGEFTLGIGTHFEPHVEQDLERQIVDFRHICSSFSLAKAERPPVSRCRLEVSRGKARRRTLLWHKVLSPPLLLTWTRTAHTHTLSIDYGPESESYFMHHQSSL